MSGPKASRAHSVRARLLNLAVKEKVPFELLAHRYAIERFLFRLQHSAFRQCFVLKGAMVFIA